MPSYTPPLRDMHFVLHELLNVTEELKLLPRHADMDVETLNAVLEEGGKFASEVLFPLNISGAVEFDDRPGPVRDALAQMVLAWHAALDRAIRIAVDTGDLQPQTDSTQMLFELHGLILALHHDARFLRIPGALGRARAGFERTLAYYSVAADAPRCAKR